MKLAGSVASEISFTRAENLIARNPTSNKVEDKVLVVLDAGISTEENLKFIKEKGYNYLCVSRTRLKDYELRPDKKAVIVTELFVSLIAIKVSFYFANIF